MDNTTFAPVNFDTIQEGLICDSGQYEVMENSNINITSIMENIDGRIKFKSVERDKNNKFFEIKIDLLKYLKNDIEDIEKELREKRHYASSNRWTPTNDIKNGFILKTRHTSLISDAAALDYILF